jgi:hypothetical protein
MNRQERIEKKGYDIIYSMCGRFVFASEFGGLRKIQGTSITDLHKKIFGY